MTLLSRLECIYLVPTCSVSSCLGVMASVEGEVMRLGIVQHTSSIAKIRLLKVKSLDYRTPKMRLYFTSRLL